MVESLARGIQNDHKTGAHQRFSAISRRLLLLLAGINAPSAIACTILPLLNPAPSGFISDARPAIKWRAAVPVAAGAAVVVPAAQYRVMLESREPEGRVLHTEDTLTANTELIPALPLAETRAAVKVLVAVDCPDLAPRDLAVQAAAFHIDVRPACGRAGQLMFDRASRRLSWQGGAPRYEVRLFDATGARLLDTATVAAPVLTVNAQIETGALAAVRPQCGGTFGEFDFVVLR